MRQKAVLSLSRLAAHMRYAGILKNNENLNKNEFEKLILSKIERVDFSSAKADMQPFATDLAQISEWSPDFFRYILTQTRIEG